MSWPATEAEAADYLQNERIGTGAWFASGFNPDPYLTQAYNSLRLDPDFSIPSSPSVSQLEKLTNANIELAFYYLENPQATKRQNLINAGVQSFSIGRFSESYKPNAGQNRDYAGSSKYPVIVSDLMRDFLKVPSLVATKKRTQENII